METRLNTKVIENIDCGLRKTIVCLLHSVDGVVVESRVDTEVDENIGCGVSRGHSVPPHKV